MNIESANELNEVYSWNHAHGGIVAYRSAVIETGAYRSTNCRCGTIRYDTMHYAPCLKKTSTFGLL